MSRITLQEIICDTKGAPMSPRKLIKIGILLVILCIALFVPFYPFSVGGEFQLIPSKQLGVRAQVTSEIQEVKVEEGQWVEAGQPLAVLLGRDQERMVEALKAALDEA